MKCFYSKYENVLCRFRICMTLTCAYLCLLFYLFIYLNSATLESVHYIPMWHFLKKKNLWTKGVIDILLRPLNLRVNVSYGSRQPQWVTKDLPNEWKWMSHLIAAIPYSISISRGLIYNSGNLLIYCNIKKKKLFFLRSHFFHALFGKLNMYLGNLGD